MGNFISPRPMWEITGVTFLHKHPPLSLSALPPSLHRTREARGALDERRRRRRRRGWSEDRANKSLLGTRISKGREGPSFAVILHNHTVFFFSFQKCAIS